MYEPHKVIIGWNVEVLKNSYSELLQIWAEGTDTWEEMSSVLKQSERGLKLEKNLADLDRAIGLIEEAQLLLNILKI